MTQTTSPSPGRATAPRIARAEAVEAAGRGLALSGGTAVLAGVTVIWIARAQVDRAVYVSELGAEGMVTAPVFNAALLVLGLGGLAVGLATAAQRAGVRVLALWSTATTLVVAGGSFVVASRVTCTAGCPVPLTSASTVQDLVHTSSAVLGFAAASWAMLQVAHGTGPRALRTFSRLSALAVALVAAIGGALSVLRFGTDVGAVLEFAAMTVGGVWLAVFAAHRGLGAAPAVTEPRVSPAVER